ncbi:hypothetical protein HO173_007025 [Letharia columbiana]|uniref:HIG1 domain-containing protein n=1 Tax=Letharia columbiana TaxID=112416 RepID=A0A8H6FU91_9LECA|nr:uncharacterized protein HO173_007025 [Letharia columbiana]KAF6234805.1 hypothetical protein HO173_007025 [Letharia columbiana]
MSDAPLPSSFDADFFEENRWQKFTRRLKEEPLIPFGVAVTCWALYNASRSIRQGNGARTNQFFRYRLYAQSFTLVAMLGGSYYYNADRLKRKEYTDLAKKRKSQEKRDAWIRELEARDQEDREWREKLGRVRDFQREEVEREAIEEMKMREGRSDDGRGVIDALKGKMKDVKNTEANKEAAELEQRKQQIKEKRREMEKKQEVERMKQAVTKQEAGMGPDTRVWGEAGGGLFGWKHIRNWFNGPRDGEGEN